MRKLGKYYEKIAKKYLKKKGYKIISENFRTRFGEIDLIALKNKTLIFVEVKGGKDYWGEPAYRVNKKKWDKIIKTAKAFLKFNDIDYEEVRIDIISVHEDGKIVHFENQRFF